MRNVEFSGQACAGCGQFAEAHPMTAVVAADDASVVPLGASDDGKFVVVPVCRACHADPAHRQVRIKGTFFTPAEALEKVRLAGERDKSGNVVRS